jgi:hypothetical protein
MYFILILIASLSSAPAMAGAGGNLCEQIFQSNAARVEPSAPRAMAPKGMDIFGFMMKLIFKPSALVEMREVHSESSLPGIGDGLKLAFLNPPITDFSEQERTSYRDYQRSMKSLKKSLDQLHFREDMKDVKTRQECFAYVERSPNVAQVLQEMEDTINKNQDLISKKEAVSVSQEIEAKERFLRRQGWTIIRSKNANEIHTQIRESRPSAVMILSHASVDGKIYDDELNAFPKGFFNSLRGYLDNLVIYSCYPEAVMENYGIPALSKDFNYFYPTAKEKIKSFLGEKTPIIALKSIRDLPLGKIIGPRPEEKCFMVLDQAIPSEFGIFLNGIFLDSGVSTVSFDCGILQDSNRIEIFSTVTNSFRGKLGVKQIKLNSERVIQLTEFSSSTTNRHIVTRGLFN